MAEAAIRQTGRMGSDLAGRDGGPSISRPWPAPHGVAARIAAFPDRIRPTGLIG